MYIAVTGSSGKLGRPAVAALRKGDILLAGDRCYTEKNLDRMILPKATADVEAGMRTFEFLQKQRESGARIMFSHDGVQWKGVVEGVGVS
jgi:N-acyl homoserine lactone hydrolase